MADDAAHKKWWQIFEVIFGIPFVGAILLHWLIPISLPLEFLKPILLPIGIILAALGITFVVNARREFNCYSQPTDPGHPTSKIITTGVFSFSRNPLYLGGILFLTGIGLAFRLPWVLILLVPSMVTCHLILIMPEEKYLAAKFGDLYQMYKSNVHRWIGRK